MPQYRTQAINLKSYNLGEADKIIVMYSKDHGIIKCVAKGVKKAKSSLGGRMQSFMANNLLLAKGRNLDIVCQAENIESFHKLKTDYDKLSYAFYCAELINVFGTENDSNSSRIYDILFETFKNISIFDNSEECMWTVLRFKLKLAEYLGYAVELDNCARCNRAEKKFRTYHFFCPETGGVICSECFLKSHKTFEIDKRHIKLFRDALCYDFPFETEYTDKNLLFSSFNILKEFISQRSDKKLKTAEMIEFSCQNSKCNYG